MLLALKINRRRRCELNLVDRQVFMQLKSERFRDIRRFV